VSEISSFETVIKRMESVRRQRRALENLLKADRISQGTYDQLIKGIENRLAEIEMRKGALANETAAKIDELKNLIELFELRLADTQIRYSAERINEENFEHERTIYTLGLESMRREIQNLRNALKRLNEKMEVKEGIKPMGEFYFYEDFDKPINQTAHNLQEFLEKLKTVPIASIDFHQERGDFSKWVRDTLQDDPLADAIEKFEERGEELRRRLIETVAERTAGPKEAKVLVRCPGCGSEANPIKTWNMAGKPSKAGERMQLTLGNFECPKCNKRFRHIIEKKRIKTTE
jgi:DNA repair exonuclease SbcCD ATPase subunit